MVNPMEPSKAGLEKTLGVGDGIALLVGITIGVGIYSTPQLIAAYQSSFYTILLLWAVVGVFVFIGGLVYAELGTRLPVTGGEYVYITRAFGPYAGFIYGWAQLFIIRTSPAAGLALITADYVGYFFDLSDVGRIATALLVILFIGTINYRGVSGASLFQRGSTWFKVAGLLLLVGLGLVLMEPAPGRLSEVLPVEDAGTGSLANLVAALMLVVFSYVGWDRVGYVAGEMKNPRKVIPVSMMLGMGMVVIVYLSCMYMYHSVLGMEGVRDSTIVASDAATRFLGPTGAAVISIMVIISALGSINGTYMSSTRVYYAMSRDGLLFKWLDHVHPRFKTPSRAILVHGIWGAVILLVRGSFETIVVGMIFAILIFYLVTTLALFKLRRENVGGEGVFKIPFYPVLPLLYLVGIAGLVILRGYYEWEKSAYDLAYIATGIPVSYFWFRGRKKSKQGAGE